MGRVRIASRTEATSARRDAQSVGRVARCCPPMRSVSTRDTSALLIFRRSTASSYATAPMSARAGWIRPCSREVAGRGSSREARLGTSEASGVRDARRIAWIGRRSARDGVRSPANVASNEQMWLRTERRWLAIGIGMWHEGEGTWLPSTGAEPRLARDDAAIGGR